jgi:hypothetical protein
MPNKHPIRYELTPRAINPGMSWVTLTLENIGEETLESLAVNLVSLDTHSIMVLGTGVFILSLAPGEAQSRHFQISAETTGKLYVSVEGRKGDEPFSWESPDLTLTVAGQPAELVRFVTATAPRALLGEPLVFEATVRGLIKSVNLVIELWVETPSGESLSLAKEGLGVLEEGEEVRPTVEFTPEEEGLHVLHAYLYQGARRIGHQVEYLSIAL